LAFSSLINVTDIEENISAANSNLPQQWQIRKATSDPLQEIGDNERPSKWRYNLPNQKE
jgi:hypothetical protein